MKSCAKTIMCICKLIDKLWTLFGTKQFGHLILIVAAFFALNQLNTLNKQLQVESINKMNDRYYGLYKQFPKVFSDKEKDMDVKYNLARRYYNSWFDEYYLCTKGYLPKEFMNVINVGACVNLKKYPDLIDAYYYWKKHDTFSHTIYLKRYIETIIDYAQRGDCDINHFREIKNCSFE